jgi:hypothetical protein
MQEYDDSIWNSGDYQFFALFTKKARNPNLRQTKLQVHLDIFSYWYGIRKTHDGEVSREPGGIIVRHEELGSFLNFLNRKPTDEVFTFPAHKGDYHLSFKKRSLFGGTELSWKFLHSQEEWGRLHNLPRRERKDKLTDFKQNEERKNFWFNDGQVNKLRNYLQSVESANS